MEEKVGSQVLFASCPLTELHIDSLKEKGGKEGKLEENTPCCGGLQLTCVFLSTSKAPKANDGEERAQLSPRLVLYHGCRSLHHLCFTVIRC